MVKNQLFQNLVLLHKENQMQQHGTKYFALKPPPTDPGGGFERSKFNIYFNMVMLHTKLKGFTNTATW